MNKFIIIFAIIFSASISFAQTNSSETAQEGDANRTDVFQKGESNDSDVDGDTLTVSSIVGQPSNGTVTINNDGTITYTPGPGFNNGTDNLHIKFVMQEVYVI